MLEARQTQLGAQQAPRPQPWSHQTCTPRHAGDCCLLMRLVTPCQHDLQECATFSSWLKSWKAGCVFEVNLWRTCAGPHSLPASSVASSSPNLAPVGLPVRMQLMFLICQSMLSGRRMQPVVTRRQPKPARRCVTSSARTTSSPNIPLSNRTVPRGSKRRVFIRSGGRPHMKRLSLPQPPRNQQAVHCHLTIQRCKHPPLSIGQQ